MNPAASDPNPHVVGRDPATLDTHSGPTVRPSRKMPKGKSAHVKKKEKGRIGVCLPCRTFSPRGSEVNSAIKASFHLFPAETRSVCVRLLRFSPCGDPFSGAIRDCVRGVCDRLDVRVCMCVPPSGDVCPLAHRNPSSKGRECSECLDRQNMSPTSEASPRVWKVTRTLVGVRAGDPLGR